MSGRVEAVLIQDIEVFLDGYTLLQENSRSLYAL